MVTTQSEQGAAGRLAIIVMGVSGSGKSSIGEGLAEALGIDFVDGDGLHSPANVAKMASGTPLVDDDRWPWLDKIGGTLGDRAAHPAGIVVACSALKKIYRDRIRAAAGQPIRFVFLDAPQSLVKDRLGAARATSCRRACSTASMRRWSVPARTSPTCFPSRSMFRSPRSCAARPPSLPAAPRSSP